MKRGNGPGEPLRAGVGLVFAPLLAGFAWINVAVGNLIAATGVGYYLSHAHPEIGAQPLAPDEEGASVE